MSAQAAADCSDRVDSTRRVLCHSRIWQLAVVAVLMLAGAIYLPALTAGAAMDDWALIRGPGAGGAASALECFSHPFLDHYFRPLTALSFFIERRIFGIHLFFYHQTNLL